MIGIFILLGGILAFIGIVTTLDLIAQRHDRRERLKPDGPVKNQS